MSNNDKIVLRTFDYWNHIKMTENICTVCHSISLLYKTGWQKAVGMILINGMLENNVDIYDIEKKDIHFFANC